MAIATGMKCLNCDKRKARDDSHYCSKKCSTAFVEAKQGPVDCVGGRWNYCDASCDDVREAKRLGWRDIEPSPEGISYNFTGYCPECVRDVQGELFTGADS